MAKIEVKNSVVEMDGDEMTRIIWQKVREKLILPYLDIDLRYFDLSIQSRDKSKRSSHRRFGECHKAAWRCGEVPREPIICQNVPRIVTHWNQPVVIARHGFGDQYKASEIKHDGPGTIRLTFTPADGSAPIEREVYKAPGAGVTMAMYNQDESIRGFARACFNYGLQRNCSVYLSTKDTILNVYDGRFRALSRKC